MCMTEKFTHPVPFRFWAAFLVESLVGTKVDGSHLVALLVSQCL